MINWRSIDFENKFQQHVNFDVNASFWLKDKFYGEKKRCNVALLTCNKLSSDAYWPNSVTFNDRHPKGLLGLPFKSRLEVRLTLLDTWLFPEFQQGGGKCEAHSGWVTDWGQFHSDTTRSTADKPNSSWRHLTIVVSLTYQHQTRWNFHLVQFLMTIWRRVDGNAFVTIFQPKAMRGELCYVQSLTSQGCFVGEFCRGCSESINEQWTMFA